MSTALPIALRPLDHILSDPATEDLAIQEPGVGWVYRGGGWHRVELPAMSYQRLHGIATLAASQTGQKINRRHPILSADLPGDLRLQAVMDPAVPAGTMALTFRRADERLDEVEEVTRLFDTSRWNKWGERLARRERTAAVLLERFDAGDLPGFLRGCVETRQTGLFCGPTGAGKAQPLDALVLTPGGWRRMGDIKTGSMVTCPDGRSASVLGVFPQGQKDIYRITFEDGRTAECCDDHLWKVWSWGKTYETGKGHANRKVISTARWEVLPLSTIRVWFDRKQIKATRAGIPLVEACAIEMPPQQLPVPPYTMGALLGDGHFRQNIAFITQDAHILNRILAELPDYEATPHGIYNHDLRMKDRSAHVRGSVALVDGETTAGLRRDGRNLLVTADGETRTLGEWAKASAIPRHVIYSRLARWGWPAEQAVGLEDRPAWKAAYSPLPLALHALGLAGTRSHTKFVPNIYKNGSVAQRIALMQGLLDTDGAASANGTYAEFSSTSHRLALDVQEVAWSLGAIAKIARRQTYYTDKAGMKKAGLPSWRVSIVHPDLAQFFSLPRKVDRCKKKSQVPRLRIVAIEKVGTKSAQCIAIDHPEHLYVTDGFVVTHNSRMSKLCGTAISLRVRIITIEDARELRLRQPNVVRHFYAASGEGVTQTQLAKATLRERPGIVLLGEMREPEAVFVFVDEVMAGHPGSLSTAHGRNPPECARRLFNMFKSSPAGRSMSDETVAAMLGNAIDFIVPVENDDGVRAIGEVWFAADARRRGETFVDLLRAA